MRTDALAQGLLSAFSAMVPAKPQRHVIIAGDCTYSISELRQRADEMLQFSRDWRSAGELMHTLIDAADASQLSQAREALDAEKRKSAALRLDVHALLLRLKAVPGPTVPVEELLEEVAAILG